MGEGKPLGACASWTIAFGPVFAAAGREPGAGPTEVPARLPLAFGSLCASLRFPVLKDLRNRALPSGQRQAVQLVPESIGLEEGFAPQAVLLVEGQAARWKGNALAGIPEDDIRRVREAGRMRLPLRGSGSFCVSVAAISGVAARSHNEKSPSFKIEPVDAVVALLRLRRRRRRFQLRDEARTISALSMPCARLARRAGVQITEAPGAAMNRGKKARLKEVCNASAEFFHTQLMRGASARRPTRPAPIWQGVIWAERCRRSGSSVLLQGRALSSHTSARRASRRKK